VLCAALLALGWVTLPSTDYKQLGIHAFAAVLFLSNIKFWREAGYFDAASHDKWLLHTWSLSVEWQFYLLFPVAVLIIWRLFRTQRSVGLFLLAGTVGSLALSLLFSSTHPSAAFYLLPTRAWELFAGGLVFLYATRLTLSPRQAALMEAAGFALIFFSAVAFSAQTRWPSGYAALPVLGAVMILLAARQHSFWIRFSPIQSIGNWSYSIYLWHWPVVVALVWLELIGQGFAVAVGLLLSVC